MRKIIRWLPVLGCGLLLQGCQTYMTKHAGMKDCAPPKPLNPNSIHNPVPHWEPKSATGNKPYTVKGYHYTPLKDAKGYVKQGTASWYGVKFQGRPTSSREPYNLYEMTAASRDLPLPTFVMVTNLDNGKQAVVKVNDRGPFARSRLIDLSYAAAVKLGFANRGTAHVQVAAINTEPLHSVHSHLASSVSSMTHAATSHSTAAFYNPKAVIHHASPSVGMHSTPTLTAADTTQPLYLQVGAFKEYRNALQLQQKIQSVTAKPVRIHLTHADPHPLYRVQIGPLHSSFESEKLRLQVTQLGISTHIHTVTEMA